MAAAADGYHVGILSSSSKGEALAQELGGVGVTGSNHNQADIQKLVDLVMERWGRVDVLVNSAGKGPRAPILELTDDDWHAGLDAYFLNVLRAARCVTPIMVKRGRRVHQRPEPSRGWRLDTFGINRRFRALR